MSKKQITENILLLYYFIMKRLLVNVHSNEVYWVQVFELNTRSLTNILPNLINLVEYKVMLSVQVPIVVLKTNNIYLGFLVNVFIIY